MNTKNCTDRRIVRTQKLLRDTLIEMLREMPIDKITPTELCRRADINRNTFYSHYGSVRELLQTFEDELMAEVEASVLNCSSGIDATVAVCKAIRRNKEIYSVLFTDNSDPAFCSRIVSIANQRTMKKISEENNTLTGNFPQMLSQFTIQGSSAVVRLWAQNGMVEEPEAIAHFIRKIVLYGSKSVTK